MPAMRANTEEDFWASVDPAGFCWYWTRTPTPKGYGRFKLDGVSYYAHRLAYQILVGPIPDEMVLDHLCRNRLCVNPDHVEVVTIGENVRRGFPGRGPGSFTR